MCGIAGVISSTPLGQNDVDKVRRMLGLMTHRGPDSEGMFVGDNVVLGMRRLSIVDLQGGAQPLYNEDRSLALVCNGEIYNHRLLRNRLERDHRFHSQSDAETILHLYEDSDDGCVQDLKGMFAFALWDERRRRLLLARDRLGEKPLYLHRDPAGHLWFASELRALISAVGADRLSTTAIRDFLTLSYIPEPVTPFEGITLLPAGHVLALTPERTDAAPVSYWDMASVPPVSAEPKSSVRAAFERACEQMGSADVPVGIALSGGIDSSLVAVVSARLYPGQMRALTVGYPGQETTDERKIAQRLCKRIGIDFTEVVIAQDQMVRDFPMLAAAMDSPVADIAGYGYLSLSRAARQQGIPVLMSGMGGDELFWGYSWVQSAVRQPGAVNGGRMASLLRKIANRLRLRQPGYRDVIDAVRSAERRAVKVLATKGANGYHSAKALELADHLSPDLAAQNMLWQAWLRSNCLTLLDRVSMAASVEMRLPFLHPDLVELVLGLRQGGMEDWHDRSKALLLDAFAGDLPEEITRRPKQGFTPPVEKWLQGITLRYRGLIKNGRLVEAGILDPRKIEPERLGLPFMYRLVLLEMWMRTAVYGESPEDLVDADR